MRNIVKKIIATSIVLIFLFSIPSQAEVLFKQNEGVRYWVGKFTDDTDGLNPLAFLETQSCTIYWADGTEADLGVTGRAWDSGTKGVYLAELFGTETTILGDGRIEYSNPTTYVPVSEYFRIVGTDTYNMLMGNNSFENNQSWGHYFRGIMAVVLGISDDSVPGSIKYNDMADSKVKVTFTITAGERTAATISGDY